MSTTPVAPMRHTKPGSMGHAIAEGVRAAVAMAGAPCTLSACEAAFGAAGAGAVPATYAAQFFSLVRRGILVRIDGRASRSRYAHRDAAPAAMPVDDADDALRVMRALEHAVQIHSGAVTTAQVRAALLADGEALASNDINAVRVRLATLARTRTSGDPRWSAARVARCDIVTAGGRRLCGWALRTADAPVAPAAPVLSLADATRTLVRHVQEQLRRPVFRRELAWWLAAHRTDAVAMAFAAHCDPTRGRTLPRALAAVVQSDARYPHADSQLVRCGERFSCWGGVAPRYWVGPLPTETALADRLHEMSMALRADDEVRQLARLARRATARRAPALQRLVEVRQGVLLGERDRHLGNNQAALRGAALTLASSFDTVRTWAKASGGDDVRYMRLEDVRHRARHAASLAALSSPTSTAPVAAIVGQAATAPHELFEPFMGALAKHYAMTDAQAHRAALRGVRRFAVEDRAGAFGAHPQRADAVLDRVDAWLALFGQVEASWARSALASATELLGPVLRDADIVAQVAPVGATPPNIRRAAIVARGTLGVAPTDAERGADEGDERAWLFAHLLAGTTPMPTTTHASLEVRMRRLARGHLLTALG